MHDFEKLSLQELLAMVMGIGPGTEVVKELSLKYSTAKDLYHAPVDELQLIKGIGNRKAMLLKAVLELGLRIATPPRDNGTAITCPNDALALLQPRMQLLDREHFVVVSLTTKNRVIAIETASIGSLNSSIVHPREIFKNAIKLNSAAVVLAHNHPSGDPAPSREDLEVTKRLVEAGKLIGIEVLDHIIIGVDAYTSFKEQGLL